MKKNYNFEFELSISQQGYTRKPINADYSNMRWEKRMISTEQFIKLILSGHSYCHIYKENRRRKDCFLYTNIVSIDVDKTEIPLDKFLTNIELKPSIAYETFSNAKNGYFSYRLIFAFEEKLNAETFVMIYDKLCKDTGLSATKDHCGKIISQLMNGTSQDAFIYHSGIVYSIERDFPEYKMDNKDISEMSVNSGIPFTSYSENNIPNNNYNTLLYSRQYYSKNHRVTSSNLFGNLISLMNFIDEHGVKIFLKQYKPFYKLVRWQPLKFNELGYTVIQENHLSLYYRFTQIGELKYVNRFKDGEKRRNKLFIDGCIIRKIKPSISLQELFYNLIHRVYFYYDNRDKILSTNLIARKATEIMEYPVEEMEFKSMNAGKITTSPAYCRNHNVTRRSYSRKALQMENYNKIAKWFNPEKSVSENL